MLKKYFFDIFLLNTGEYSNIGFELYINLVLFAIALGMCAAIFVIGVRRTKMAALVKQLLRHGATEEREAITISELGLVKSRILTKILTGDGQMKKIVRRVGEVRYTYEEYAALMKAKKLPREEINLDEARFYLDKDGINRARRIYESYNSSVAKTVALALHVMAIFVCASLCMPGFFDWVNSLLG